MYTVELYKYIFRTFIFQKPIILYFENHTLKVREIICLLSYANYIFIVGARLKLN